MKFMKDSIGEPSLLSLDPADINSILKGYALEIYMFEGRNVNNAITAALKSSDRKSMKSALISITGNKDVKIRRCKEIVETVASHFKPNAKILWGAKIDEKLKVPKVTALVGKKVKSWDYLDSLVREFDKPKKSRKRGKKR